MTDFDTDDIEEAIYEMVAEEVARGEYKPGLQAKAIAETGGDEAKAKAHYLALRAHQIAKDLESKARAAAADAERIKAEQRENLVREKAEEQRARKAEADLNTTFGQRAFNNFLITIVISTLVILMVLWLLS